MRPTVRRIVTGHDKGGLAVVRSDSAITPIDVPSGDAKFALIWTTNRFPADNEDETDGAKREIGITSRGGSALRIVDMLPGRRSPMHRTNSIDYGIVLEGELDLELESGEVTHLKVGDIVVQRGTNHAWVNSSDKPVRMAFVLIDADPVRIDGSPLEEIHP